MTKMLSQSSSLHWWGSGIIPLQGITTSGSDFQDGYEVENGSGLNKNTKQVC